jgi:hypothetical protein
VEAGGLVGGAIDADHMPGGSCKAVDDGAAMRQLRPISTLGRTTESCT